MIDIEQVKLDIVKALKPLNPEKIILFGSYAYGNPTEDSDLDICVVEKKYESQIEDALKIRNLLSHIRISKDILNPRLNEYKFYSREINSVYYDIETKGDLLWKKSF